MREVYLQTMGAIKHLLSVDKPSVDVTDFLRYVRETSLSSSQRVTTAD